MERKGSKQLYNKLLFIYTAVNVCVVLALMFYFWNSTRNSYLERNQEYLHRMHEEAVEYVNDCRDISTYLHEELYKSNMEMNDLLHYLTDAPEKYQEYRLVGSPVSLIIKFMIPMCLCRCFDLWRNRRGRTDSFSGSRY